MNQTNVNVLRDTLETTAIRYITFMYYNYYNTIYVSVVILLPI